MGGGKALQEVWATQERELARASNHRVGAAAGTHAIRPLWWPWTWGEMDISVVKTKVGWIQFLTGQFLKIITYSIWQESRAIGRRNNQRCPWRKKFEKLWSDPTSYTDEGVLTQRQVSDLFRITCLFSDRERTWILSAPGSVQVIIKAEKLHQLRPGSESSQSQALQSCWKERDMCSVALRPRAGPDLIRPWATAPHYKNKERVKMGANGTVSRC